MRTIAEAVREELKAEEEIRTKKYQRIVRGLPKTLIMLNELARKGKGFGNSDEFVSENERYLSMESDLNRVGLLDSRYYGLYQNALKGELNLRKLRRIKVE